MKTDHPVKTIFGWTWCSKRKKNDVFLIKKKKEKKNYNLPIIQRGFSAGIHRPWLHVNPDGP